MSTSSTPPPYGIRRALGFLVLRSQRLLCQQLEAAFAPVGLTVPQHVALQLVNEGIATGPSDIAKMLGYDTGSATRLVDQLADKGLIERRREPGDRRMVTLNLTDEGVSAAGSAQAASNDFTRSLLASFSEAETEDFLAYLSRLVTLLEERADA